MTTPIRELGQIAAELRRLAAENEALRKQNLEWLKANGPGGWIDALRKARDIDKIMALADEYAQATSAATFIYERGGGHSGDRDKAEARAALVEALK